MPWDHSILHEIQTQYGVEMPNLQAAYDLSESTLALLDERVGSVLPSETSFVVFGSLGRKEFHAESDLDWSLLIDGRADAAHRTTALKLQEVLIESGLFKKPNPTGNFGGMVFSHELIHNIGGLNDTNGNLTRRLLLLLESTGIGDDTTQPRRRLVRGILERYFQEEGFFPEKREAFFPRFFMNDVVRFWRTMAVDYVAKNSERGAEGWALRSAKLRFSRKILYIAGLLLTFETKLFPEAPEIEQSAEAPLSATERCYQATEYTPLELFARACLKLKLPTQPVRQAFELYDRFLATVQDKNKRERLGELTFETAEASPHFQEIRMLGREFQKAIDHLFVEHEGDLKTLTLRYGVF